MTILDAEATDRQRIRNIFGNGLPVDAVLRAEIQPEAVVQLGDDDSPSIYSGSMDRGHRDLGGHETD